MIKDLNEANIYSQIDKGTQADLNENYNILESALKLCYEKHFPYKYVKFNKH